MNDKYEAIAWLANIKEKYIHGGDEEFDECRRESIDMAIKALRQPKEQPEIVRCKDCRHFEPEGIYTMCYRHNGLSPNEDWFCADGERRTDDD